MCRYFFFDLTLHFVNTFKRSHLQIFQLLQRGLLNLVESIKKNFGEQFETENTDALFIQVFFFCHQIEQVTHHTRLSREEGIF